MTLPPRRAGPLALLALFGAAACSDAAAPPPAAPAPAQPIVHTLRFGANADELLETVCPAAGDPARQPCAILVADVRQGTAVRIVADAGRSLAWPAWLDGRIVAARTAARGDALGNHAAELIGFAAAGGQADRLAAAPATLSFPERIDGRLHAWRATCRAADHVWCAHDLVVVADGGVRPAGPRRYGFREVGRIVSGGAPPVVSANFPADALAIGAGFVEWTDGSAVWRLAPAARFGLARLSPALTVLAAAPAPRGDRILFATGTEIGLYRQRDGAPDELLAALPETIPLEGATVLGMDVSADGGRVALLIGGTARDPASRVILYEVARRAWRPLPPPRVTVTHAIS